MDLPTHVRSAPRAADLTPPAPPPEPARLSRAWPPRGPLVYYLLAAFDVLAVSASLYLNHRIVTIYVESVEANQEWAQRMEDYSVLGQLAAQVNAPGNDVFDSRAVAAELARMQTALGIFNARLDSLRRELRRSASQANAQALLGHLDDVERAMAQMVAEARLIFSHFAAGQREPAGERMATMDRKYARLLASLQELGAHVASIQRHQFEHQMAAAGALQRFEYGIAGLILLMVAAATVYGRRLSRQAGRDARERGAYVLSLQAAEESLRRAHAELEQRVLERTDALRASEAALRRSAAEWERTFEAIDSPVMILAPEGHTLRLNRAASELAGQREGEPWRGAAEVQRQVCERRVVTSLEARDEHSGRTWEISGNLVPDEQGQGAERVIVVARDVTRLVELQESVRREERMAAMGSLVAGVAHEVRNPLFGISSTVDALEARYGASEPPFRKYFDVLRREVDRLGALMRDLLDYGKPPGLDPVEVDFDAVVDEAIRLCEPLAASVGGNIVRASGRGTPRVRLDRWRVLQALQNVVQNALQHSPRGGRVTVDVGHANDGGRDWVWCAVRDAGPGFAAADLPRLFEPFFSRRGGGTGLGLSIAQRVVSQHGGLLEAANHPEGGAVVSLKLPAGLEGSA